MAESSLLMFSARDLLATPSHERLAYFVEQLYKPHETYEYQGAQALYKFCVANFSNCLTLMLLKVYLHSPDDLIRFRAISLLSEALTGLRNRSFELSPVALDVIKPLLVSCLTMPEAKKPDTKMLRIIVSCVARNAMKLDPHGWDELGDCMLTLVNTDPVRAFNVFLDLPQLSVGFINRFFKHLIEEIEDVLLLSDEQDRDEEYWSLALETAVKLGIQLSNSEKGLDVARVILDTVLKSANLLVRKGEEQFLQRGFAHLVKFLALDANTCRYSRNQCGFLSEFSFKISRIGTHTKEAAMKINLMVTKLENHNGCINYDERHV
ncbi:BnaA08g19520D [Brassica napus]|uniref:BnaA08g19520D protein n=1 Tax=Brassica napus TaxID=3708 RepID=A0A078HE88_BRANA|nr:BnaA08g19520D [Brassica napus]